MTTTDAAQRRHLEALVEKAKTGGLSAVQLGIPITIRDGRRTRPPNSKPGSTPSARGKGGRALDDFGTKLLAADAASAATSSDVKLTDRGCR